MRLFLFASILFFPAFLFAQSEDCHCLKPEFEIGIGPQWSIPVITDYDVGLLGNDEPSKQGQIGYSFHLAVRTHPANFQAGLELLQDLKRFNIYLPLYWPSMETSHFNNAYTSYRLGVGTHLRYNFNNFYIQGGIAYMEEFSYATHVEFEEPGAPGHVYDESYSPDSGLLINAIIGIKDNSERFSAGLGFGYDAAIHEFNHEQFEHYWKARVNIVSLTINYRLNTIE